MKKSGWRGTVSQLVVLERRILSERMPPDQTEPA